MWDYIKGFFKGLGKFFKVFVTTTVSSMVEDIGSIAVETVKRVENQNKDLSGKEKYLLAYEHLTNILVQRGIKYSKNAANIALEMAVAVMKEEK